MTSQIRNTTRKLVLLSAFGAVAFVLGKILLVSPTVETDSSILAKTVELPATIPLSGWEATSTEQLKDHGAARHNYIQGKEYRYTQGSTTLSVQARYFVGTSGNVRKFINNYLPATEVSLQKDIKQKNWQVQSLDKTGSFLVIAEAGSFQVSSCINPHGKSTVSARAYKQNRNFQDIRYRLIPWLLGEPLKDERCLWTHMFIEKQIEKKIKQHTEQQQNELANSQIEMLEPLIQEAWSDWYTWWSPRLAKMGR
ncbi:MAG: cyanoexosortase A system-associated protein [Cyanobacteria bacterium P01_C01_bin.69]